MARPLVHSIMEVTSLEWSPDGRRLVLVVYPNQHHGIDSSKYTQDLYERYLGWYKKYLKSE